MFGEFETATSRVTDPNNADYFMERLPATATTATTIRATVSGGSCGAASITFTMSADLLKYLQDGT